MIHNRDPWDRNNFHFHRVDPTPWIPIEEERDQWKFSKWAFVTVILVTVIAAILFNTAEAAPLAYSRNELGGKIVLTDVKCTTGSGSVAYSTNPKGQSVFGCWVYDDVYVHILWNGTASPRAYDLSTWQLVKETVVPTM